jgi:hypothetical protein
MPVGASLFYRAGQIGQKLSNTNENCEKRPPYKRSLSGKKYFAYNHHVEAFKRIQMGGKQQRGEVFPTPGDFLLSITSPRHDFFLLLRGVSGVDNVPPSSSVKNRRKKCNDVVDFCRSCFDVF